MKTTPKHMQMANGMVLLGFWASSPAEIGQILDISFRKHSDINLKTYWQWRWCRNLESQRNKWQRLQWSLWIQRARIHPILLFLERRDLQFLPVGFANCGNRLLFFFFFENEWIMFHVYYVRDKWLYFWNIRKWWRTRRYTSCTWWKCCWNE